MTMKSVPTACRFQVSRLMADFRRKADQCARLADGAVPHDVADALRLMAEEYEGRAARLEAKAPPRGAAEAAMSPPA
jgi:hypothetical protein